MKTISRCIFILLLIVIISCQPSLLVKKEQPRAKVDSVLFYQQKDISDPFIDAVIAAKADTFTLHARLVPPPPPPLKYKEIEGFRVQAFAGLDSINALSIRHRIKSAQTDSVYLFKDKGLFKIQVGDFLYRNDAEKKKKDLRQNGYPGAWVVQTTIRIPKDTPADTTMNPVNKAENDRQEDRGFRIQILATADSLRAEGLSEEIKQKYNLPVIIHKAGTLYKVFIGNFSSREKAEAELKKLRTGGYPDAWIVK